MKTQGKDVHSCLLLGVLHIHLIFLEGRLAKLVKSLKYGCKIFPQRFHI
jgi:hypothetical protein